MLLTSDGLFISWLLGFVVVVDVVVVGAAGTVRFKYPPPASTFLFSSQFLPVKPSLQMQRKSPSSSAREMQVPLFSQVPG